MKKRQVKINLTLHRISLKVKFPCSVSAILKAGNQQIDIPGEKALKNNEAVFESQIQKQFKATFDTINDCYPEKLLTVTLFLKSSGNRIPAGYSILYLNDLVQGSHSFASSVHNCPDKDALIDFSLAYEILSETENVQMESLQLPQNNYNRRRTPSARSSKAREDDFSKQKRLTKYKTARFKKFQNQDQNEVNLSKYVQLQRQKIGAQRQISILRCEIEENKQLRRVQSEMIKFKDLQKEFEEKKKLLFSNELQLSNKKHRIMEIERQNKTLQKKLEVQSSKLINIEQNIEKREKICKQIEEQSKKIYQKYQDLKMLQQSLEKRFEYKQNSLREQLKTLSEKLSNSQHQKQKMIFQKNQIIEEFEEREKIIRQNFRDKEKGQHDEKNRQLKRIEILNREIVQLKKQIEKNQFKQHQNIENYQKINIKYLQVHQLHQSKIREIERLERENKDYLTKSELLCQSRSTIQELQQERKKLKRQTFEKEQQRSRIRQEINHLETNNQKLQKNKDELQKILTQKNGTSKALQRQNEQLSRSNEKYKKQIAQRQKQLKQIKFLMENQTTKIGNLKDEGRQKDRKHKEQYNDLKAKFNERQNRIKMLTNELQSNSNDISAYNEKIEEIYRQNEDIKNRGGQMSRHITKIQVQNDQLFFQRQQLLHKIEGYEKDAEMKGSENKKMYSEWQSKQKEMEQEITNLLTLLKSKEEQMGHKEELFTSKLKQKQNQILRQLSQINKVSENVQQLKFENGKLKNSIDEANYENSLKIKQVFFLKESLDKANQQLKDYLLENKDVSAKRQHLENEITKLNKQKDELKKQIQKLTQENLKKSKLLSQKQNKIKFIESQSGSIHQKFQKHIQQAMKQRQKYESDTLKLQEVIESQKNEINQIQKEKKQIEKQKKLGIEEKCIIIKKIQQRVKQLQNQSKRSNEDLKKEYIKKQTGFKKEIENATKKINELLESSQKQKNIHQKMLKDKKKLQDEFSSLSDKMKGLHQESKQSQKDTIKLKKQLENKIEGLKQRTQVQKSKLEQFQRQKKQFLKKINEEQKDKANFKKQLSQKVSKLEKQLQKVASDHQSSQTKLKNEISNSKNAYQQLQKQILKSQELHKKQQLQKENLQKDLIKLNHQNAQVLQKNKILSSELEFVSKQTNLQSDLLLPIKEATITIQSHCRQYSRVGDQFEASKNKLTRMSVLRSDVNENYLVKKMREINLCFLKFKSVLLLKSDFSSKQKQKITQQMSKFQLTLDETGKMI